MASRLDLQTELETILGSRNVYFQPPSSVTMKYPAIRYSLADIENDFADDEVYIQSRRYEITVIDKNPDSVIADKISRMHTCRFNRQYASDNLNHFTFTITY